MTILVFGQTGQVATDLGRMFEDTQTVSRAEADLEDPERCAAIVRETSARAVINAAAYTNVEGAEDDEARVRLVNAQAPRAMALAAAERGLPFVHISTDYVFDGSGTAPWAPSDATGPLGVYGQTKLEGEDAVRAAGGKHAILRTSWVFSAHGHNFVKTMLRLGAERERLTIVADQVGGPTPAADIAAACHRMAHMLADGEGTTGTYHFAGAPDVSWAGFAREIFAQAGLAPEVVDITTAEFPTKARRPANSRLDCRTLDDKFGIARPDWRAGLAAVLVELNVTNCTGRTTS